MKDFHGFLLEAAETGIGFTTRLDHLYKSDYNAIIACCEFLAYAGEILWYPKRFRVVEQKYYILLEVIPQPKF